MDNTFKPIWPLLWKRVEPYVDMKRLERCFEDRYRTGLSLGIHMPRDLALALVQEAGAEPLPMRRQRFYSAKLLLLDGRAFLVLRALNKRDEPFGMPKLVTRCWLKPKGQRGYVLLPGERKFFLRCYSHTLCFTTTEDGKTAVHARYRPLPPRIMQSVQAYAPDDKEKSS